MKTTQGLDGSIMCRGTTYPLEAWALVERQGAIQGAAAFSPLVAPEPGDKVCMRLGDELIVLWSPLADVHSHENGETVLTRFEAPSEVVRKAKSFEPWHDPLLMTSEDVAGVLRECDTNLT